MKLPKKVKVGYCTYSVSFASHLGEKDEDFAGLHSPSSSRIYLKSGMSDQYTAETLMHEVSHAIADKYNIKLGEKEEDVVASFSLGMTAFMADNPELIKELLKVLK